VSRGCSRPPGRKKKIKPTAFTCYEVLFDFTTSRQKTSQSRGCGEGTAGGLEEREASTSTGSADDLHWPL